MKYIKYFRENQTVQDLDSANSMLKLTGLKVTRLKKFIPHPNKIARGVTPKNRFKVNYNFMNTIFKNIVLALYKQEFNIKKLNWILIHDEHYSPEIASSIINNISNMSDSYHIVKLIKQAKYKGNTLYNTLYDFNSDIFNKAEQMGDMGFGDN
jgi:hypothetical protein